MSASNKKKLRKEQAAEQLTARQQQEQAEAKKLKFYTVSFVATMIAIVLIVATVLGVQYVQNSGLIEKHTIAATVGNRELNTVELNYYYIDAVNNFYSQWSEYYSDNADAYLKAIYGLDTAVPLDQQYTDEAKTETWAKYFVNQAISQAQNDYAMYDLATKDGFTLSESSKASIESNITMLGTYAAIYGYSNADQYLSAIYGSGANAKTYKAYCERSQIAAEYYAAKADTFVYTDEQRAAYEADKKATFNSYAYDSLYLTYTDFRGEGTKGEDGKITYTDEQNNEARTKMEEYAKQLASTVKNLDELKEAIKTAPVSKGKTLNVTTESNVLHNEVSTAELRDWLASTDRKAGDIAAIPNKSTTKDEAGKETTTINGYYVVIYKEVTDNTTPMADVGYIFVPYSGGVEDEDSGEMIYTEDDKKATRAKAEEYLKQWAEGAKTATSFEELANKLINDKKAKTGGLVENLNPASDFDAAIMKWALEETRAANDTTIIEADNGFYLMLYSAKSKLNYRQYMIDTEMRSKDYTDWYNASIAAVPTAVKDLSKMDLSLTISAK